MKVWIVVLAILLLLTLIVREKFETYEEALQFAIGQSPEYVLPRCESGFTLSSNKDSCEKTNPDGTKEKKQPTCPSGTSYMFRETEGNCEPNNATSPSQTMTDPDCPTGYTFNRDAGICEKRESDGSLKRQRGTCPDGNRVNDVGRCTVFEDSSSSTESETYTCPDGYTIAFERDSNGSLKEQCEKTSNPTCPTGYTNVSGMCTKSGSASVSPTCAEGTLTENGQKCKDIKEKIKSSRNERDRDREANKTTGGSWTGSVGGGSSGNLIGPTSGSIGSSRSIWGPIFAGVGEDATGGTGDTTQTNRYPELMGGLMGKTSSRIPGVGIVSPSQPGLDTSVLPSSASTGTDANARFLPFSRQPGDMDIVPDPYRLASSYSTKNYAPQKEPVPFLTDFSAFFK